MRTAACLLSVILVSATACGGGDTPSVEEAAPSAPTPNVPTATERLYLATALACSKLEGQDARFTPLKVEGDGFSTTIKPVQDCQEQRMFNSYVYDVPVPASGEIRVTPGNQPPAALDVAQLTKSGAVTVYYARKGEGRFEVSTMEYVKTDAVKDAA